MIIDNNAPQTASPPALVQIDHQRCIMAKIDTKLKRNKRFFIIALVLILLSNIGMGITLVIMSKNALRDQVEQRMLDVANTAAAQLDGDALEKLTAADKGTESYNKALGILQSFQSSINLDYIYAIRADDNDKFSFLIDPDPDSPGEFGKAIETTDALVTASEGTAAVDKEPYEDQWGNFYSAYSPVFDKKGNVAAIVGVDFNAKWYDSMLSSHKVVFVALTMIVVTMGIVLIFTMHAFVLEDEKNRYKKELEKTVKREREQKQELGSAKLLAYTDPLTGVKNKLSYIEEVEILNKDIEQGSIDKFGVVVFDLNGLKAINDTLGHDEGDKYIQAGSRLICLKFCHSPVYRIGGDEFVVMLQGTDYKYRDNLLAEFDLQVERNLEKGDVVVATGMSTFDKEKDDDYLSVFGRADKKMYERKRQLKKEQK